MSKPKQSFAIAKSIFGDYWIGKTKLEPNGVSVFSTFEEATEEAIELTDSISNRDELESILEEDVEDIDAECEKWII